MAEHSILVRDYGSSGPWSEPETSAYDNEAHLQLLLAEDPARLPGVPEGSLAVRELGTAAGPVDICVVHPNGELTVVECKLSSNGEKRRMVIGQVIDYAAAIHEDGIQLFRERWIQRGGQDLDVFLDPEASAKLAENVGSGQINLCLAVDRIDADLRRLVEFLNRVSLDEVKVTALQLSYARQGDLEILIPATFGTELANSKQPKTGKPTPWTWPEFVGSLHHEVDIATAEDLFARLQASETLGKYNKVWFGTQPRGGIFFQIHNQRFSPFQLWRSANGELRIFGNWGVWEARRNDPRFARLAEALGQSHEGKSASVPASTIDIDEFWKVAVECDLRINED